MKGNFTVRKTRRAFLFIVIIQAHKQNNDVVLSDRGADDLTQNSEALRRWAVAGSEMARQIAEFDKSMDAANNKRLREETSHHEQIRLCVLDADAHADADSDA